MSSLIHRPNQNLWLQFTLRGKRKTLRLGKVSVRHAATIQQHLDELILSEKLNVPPDVRTRSWVTEIPHDFQERLFTLGLIRSVSANSLGRALSLVCSDRKVSVSTESFRQQVREKLIAFFGDDLALSTITTGDVEAWRRWLAVAGSKGGTPLAPATVASRGKQAANWFGQFVSRGWITENPFDGMKGWSKANPERSRFVTRDAVLRIMDHSDPETRLVLALARWGGLRVPSEVCALRLDHACWERGVLTIPCVKTSRYEGREFRQIPMFPVLREELNDAWDRAIPGQEYFITERLTGGGFTRRVKSAAKRAGVALWPRLFQNLRASRETELADDFPSHVVSGWIGHSSAVAERHYLQITKEHLASALAEAKPEAVRRSQDG